jgi:hypothetical protein
MIRKIILYLFLAFFCFCTTQHVYCQQVEEKFEVEEAASTVTETYNNDYAEPVKVNSNNKEYFNKRNYDRNRLEALRKKKDFQYNDDVADDYKKEWEANKKNPNYGKEERTFKEKSGGKDRELQTEKDKKQSRDDYQKEHNKSLLGINWLLIILIGVGLVFVILYFSGFKPNSLFRQKSNASFDTTIDEEHIDNIAFETELEKAIRLKNYRLAIRILYLETLKKLNDKKSINWQRNKTNWDYVSEIEPKLWKKDFQKITNSFEYAWYGNFDIDESTFALVQEQINLFKQKISN